MTRADAATIMRGLAPQGCDLRRLTPEGRAELTAAVDVVLRLAKEGEEK